jgi:hypothetical protein
MLRSSITILLIACALSGAAQKKSKSDSDVLFTVNNRPVTTPEFLYLYNKNYKDRQDEFRNTLICLSNLN